ncbi:MAG: c-type cytochrome [Chlorobi bacterium]|nr:c-type cytochrome [Chlorobiota bacterium]
MENKKTYPKKVFEGYNEKYDQKLMIEHDYDGIRELDNPPPPWLMWLFYLTVFWALGYAAYFHFFHIGPLQAEEYKIEMAEAAKKYKKSDAGTKQIVLLTDETSLNAGAATYAKSCAACHGPEGKGGIGVNLTDNKWIYGDSPENIFKTIKNGTNKGMASFSSLSDEKLMQVTSFILQKLQPPKVTDTKDNTDSNN